MKLEKLFHQFSHEEYVKVIDFHKEYSNFNTLGLFRSIIENE